MKQYEKIWVPSESPHPPEERNINGLHHKPRTNAIVVSLEDLKNLWEASEHRCIMEVQGIARGLKTPTFEEYLRSKGIKV